VLDTQVQLLAELDAELGQSLSIAASPDFAARVARQAREARAQRWILAPAWAGVGVAAVIMLSVWVSRAPLDDATAFRLKPEATRPRAGDVLLKAESTEAPKPPLPDCVASGFSRKVAGGGCASAAVTAARRRNNSVRPNRTLATEPPVIVEPSRALAIQRLRELMIAGRLDGDMLPPPRTPEAVLAELIVPPLAVSEIKVPDVDIVSRPPAASQERQ
jgi:hypothetical protein